MKFKKSQFVSLDAEFVQWKNAPSKVEIHKAVRVAVYHKDGRFLKKNIQWEKDDVEINDATTRINGLTYDSVARGEDFEKVSKRVAEILNDKIVLTVGGSTDIRSMNLDEGKFRRFDLQSFYYREDPNNPTCQQGMSLRDIVFYHTQQDIQQGVHCCLQDAFWTSNAFFHSFTSDATKDVFWDGDGKRIVDFNDQVNLNSKAKKKLFWCSQRKVFGAKCFCDVCKQQRQKSIHILDSDTKDLFD
jgi:hypothetical protein